MLRWLARVLAALVAAILLAAGAAWAVSARKLGARYPAPAESVAVPTDSATIAHGGHLFLAVASCTVCHGDDAGGHVYSDDGAIGRLVGSNLTRGRGGVAPSRTNEDWVRAIRYGVHRDSTSLMVMPSEVFAHLSDRDLGAIIAYLRQVPPVDRELPASGFGPVGRILLGFGKMNILVAPKTPRGVASVPIDPAPTAAYGRYIADISGCHGCHGYGLSGGRVAGPPGLPPASNLTPAGIGRWSEADFRRALREGRRPDGTALDEFMPWKQFSRMTDDELRAIWLYLRSVPPRAFGGK